MSATMVPFLLTCSRMPSMHSPALTASKMVIFNVFLSSANLIDSLRIRLMNAQRVIIRPTPRLLGKIY